MTEKLILDREDSILRLTMNRPEKKNALDRESYEALITALAQAEAEAAVRVVVISGNGGAFTAGNDLLDFASFTGDFATFPALQFVRALAAFPKPLVAAVEGDAIGVGATVLFHCDLVYAAPNARFKMPFVDLGLVPEGASSLLVPQRLGLARASQYLLLCDGFDAEEALRFGVVNAIAAQGEVLDLAMTAARRLAQKPAEALLAARRLIRGEATDALAAIDREAEQFVKALASPEARARLQAFLSRRQV